MPLAQDSPSCSPGRHGTVPAAPLAMSRGGEQALSHHCRGREQAHSPLLTRITPRGPHRSLDTEATSAGTLTTDRQPPESVWDVGSPLTPLSRACAVRQMTHLLGWACWGTASHMGPLGGARPLGLGPSHARPSYGAQEGSAPGVGAGAAGGGTAGAVLGMSPSADAHMASPWRGGTLPAGMGTTSVQPGPRSSWSLAPGLAPCRPSCAGVS